MIVTATEFKANLGKYLEMATSQDIFITKNRKSIARLTSPAVDKLALLDDLVGIVPPRRRQWMNIPYGRSGCPNNENTN